MSAPGENLWLTARQIADLRLAGLPASERGVQKRADQEGWQARERAGRGGGKVYHLFGLPQPAREDYAARQVETLPAATRPAGRPKGSGFFDRNPEVARAVEAFVAQRKVSARNLLKLLAAEGLELPTKRTLQRFVAELEERNAVLFTSLRDPDRYKSQYRLSLGQMDRTVSYAHEMWEIDTTKADVHCTDGRWSVLGIIDRWCRRTRFLVVPSESAQSVRRMLVTTIAAWGVMPAVLKVDNGSGFINATIQTALDLLGIDLDPCLPGTPEDKPHVERVFGTFTRERASLLKGFAGHSVADAQKLRAAAKKQTGRAQIEAGITGAELQVILDAWCDGEYHVRTHSTLRCSPMERWQSSPQPARAAASENQLRIVLSAYVGEATVGKRGVRWKHGRYWSSALLPYMGKQVILRRDEDDLGALFVLDADNRFIDVAVDAARSGFSEQQFATAARREQTEFMNRAKAELRGKMSQYKFEDAVQKTLRAEAEAAGKLTHLPPPTIARETATMRSIDARPAPAPYSAPADQARLDEAMRRTQPVVAAQSIEARVAETDAVLAAADRGEIVDPAALARARQYAATSDYRAQKVAVGEFAISRPGQLIPARRGVA